MQGKVVRLMDRETEREIWKRVQGRKLSLSAKLVIGVIYGLCACRGPHP